MSKTKSGAKMPLAAPAKGATTTGKKAAGTPASAKQEPGSAKPATKPKMQHQFAGTSSKSDVPCNICGGMAFRPGPGGRLSSTKQPPVCIGCGSLERHRVFRSIFDKIRGPVFKELSCLAFNRDRSVAGGWFDSIQYSEPDSRHALDVENISIPSGGVDVVLCNHVLSSVPSYEQALRELVRVISGRGFAFVSFPNPHYRQITDDWGYPKPQQHNQYRIFGADIETKLPTILPGIGIARVVDEDPVTGAEDRAYIISKNRNFMGQLGERGLKLRFLHF